MTLEDTKGQPHIVLLRSHTDVKLVEFDGTDAMEQAHRFAEKAACDSPVCAIVAVRVRQICNSRNADLMT